MKWRGAFAGVSLVSTVLVEAVGATWSGSPRRGAGGSSRLSIPELAPVSGGIRERTCPDWTRPTERLPRKGENKSLAAISNTCYNLIPVTYEKRNFQPGMDPPDPSIAAPPDQPARPHLAQAAGARRRGDQEFGLRPTLQREDARRFPVAQTGDRIVERRGDRLSRRRGRGGHRRGDPRRIPKGARRGVRACHGGTGWTDRGDPRAEARRSSLGRASRRTRGRSRQAAQGTRARRLN